MTEVASEASPSLTRSALTGVASNWTGAGVLILAQIASTAVTARLVAPHEFGVYAAALAATGLAGYFTMAAVGPGLQRRESVDERIVGTALSISLGASFAVVAALWVGAPLWSQAWGMEDATDVVRVLAVSQLLVSMATVPLAVMRRELRFGTTAMIETGALVFALAAGVALAVEMHSAMALALGQLGGGALLLVAAASASRLRVRPRFDGQSASELLRFGSQVSALNLVTYVSNTVPSWFVARAFGPATLGLYSRAYMVVHLPLTYLAAGILKVILPVYGHLRSDLARSRSLIREGLTLATGFVWPMLGLLAGAAPVVVEALLGSRWADASPFLALLALAGGGYLASEVLTYAAQALDWMRPIAVRQFVCLAATVAALGAAAAADLSLAWALAGVALAQWGSYALIVRAFVRRGALEPARVLGGIQLLHLLLAVAAFGAAASCAELLEQAPLATRVIAEGGVAALVLSVLLTGRSWIPATAVLARRLGARPGHDLVRAGIAAWGSR